VSEWLPPSRRVCCPDCCRVFDILDEAEPFDRCPECGDWE
jgi:hypothetical protein